jgi:hypothetical protein
MTSRQARGEPRRIESNLEAIPLQPDHSYPATRDAGAFLQGREGVMPASNAARTAIRSV